MSLPRMPGPLGTARTAGRCTCRKRFRDVTSLSSFNFRPPQVVGNRPKSALTALAGVCSRCSRQSRTQRLTGPNRVGVARLVRFTLFLGGNLAAGLFLVTLRLVHTLPHHLLWVLSLMRCGLRREAQAAEECSSGCFPGATYRFSHTARS